MEQKETAKNGKAIKYVVMSWKEIANNNSNNKIFVFVFDFGKIYPRITAYT